VLFDAVFRAGLELVEVPAGLGDADDRKREAFILDHALEGGEDLLECEVAGGAEEHKGIGLLLHSFLLQSYLV